MATTAMAKRTKGHGTDMQPERRRFTVDEYYRMAKAGILQRDERLELLEGEIIQMSPIGNRHAGSVKTMNEQFVPRLLGRATVSIQDPVHLADGSEPVPDVMLLRYRADRYAGAHPVPADVLLLVEVSDTTLRYDRDRKLLIYARAGIPEFWIVDLGHNRVLVYRQPGEDGYWQEFVVRSNGTLTPMAFPDITLSVAEILGRS